MGSMVQAAYDMGITDTLGGMPRDSFYRDYDYGRTNHHHKTKDEFSIAVSAYVKLMRETGINTIVGMNKYLTNKGLWENFKSIRRMNTYSSGFSSVGVSREAYSAINELYVTADNITSRLERSERVA